MVVSGPATTVVCTSVMVSTSVIVTYTVSVVICGLVTVVVNVVFCSTGQYRAQDGQASTVRVNVFTTVYVVGLGVTSMLGNGLVAVDDEVSDELVCHEVAAAEGVSASFPSLHPAPQPFHPSAL